MEAKNRAVNCPKTHRRPWHTANTVKLFSWDVTVAAAGSQLLLLTVCPRYFSLKPQRPVAPVSCYATGVVEARPPSSTPSPPLPPLHPLPDDFIVWKVVASECSKSEAGAYWSNGWPVELAQVCRTTVCWEAAKVFFLFSFLLSFLKNRCDDLILGCTCATPTVRLHLNASVRTIRVWQNDSQCKNSRSFDRISKSDMSELMCPKHASMLKMWAPHGLWAQPTQLWDYSAHRTTKGPHHISITQKKGRSSFSVRLSWV